MEKIFTQLPEKQRMILEEMRQTSKFLSTGGNDSPGTPSQEWKGYQFIPGFNPDTTRRYFEEMEIEENTIFLCSYPKTGTHWFYEVIRLIVYGDNEELDAVSKNIPMMLLMLELGKPSKLDLYEYIALPRKIILNHLPANLTDFEKMKKAKAKIIIPVRNPKDQAVSWFHFTQNKHFDGIRDIISPTWPQFLLEYVHGKQPTTSKPGEWYPEFLLSWHKYKDEDNVLFVHFEDMKKDPEDSIKRMADFLDVELTADRVAAIARASSFDAMKKRQEKSATEMAKLDSRMNMLRKGQAGAWKNTFTVAQSEMMDKIIEEKLGYTDIEFRYE